jgi:hypothetical protein
VDGGLNRNAVADDTAAWIDALPTRLFDLKNIREKSKKRPRPANENDK